MRHWWINIYPYPDPSPLDAFYRGHAADWSAPEFDGTFQLQLPDGSFRIQLAARCRGRSQSLGWYGADGEHASTREEVRPLVVDGSDIDEIDFRLPAAPSEIDEICDFGPRREVRGTVVGPDGAPLGRVSRILATDERSAGWVYGGDTVLAGIDGSFVLSLPDGVYNYRALLLAEPINRETVEWLSLSLDSSMLEPMFFAVDGEEVSGLRIKILDRQSASDHVRLDRLGKTAGSPQ